MFSSGPCTKRPGWSTAAIGDALLGRSHRSQIGKSRLREVIEKTAYLLRLPDDWRLGIVPGSDTGAFEMAMWSLLGARGVDVLVWENFGAGWAKNIEVELQIPNSRVLEADYGYIPDLSAVDFRSDVVFVWNGTTSGVRVPDGDWIPSDREGLTLCDATSAVFAQELPWDKLDVVTFSWQKVLGGEAGHGMIVLSPRAIQRAESYIPKWPIPRIFRLTKNGKINAGLFQGETINTPSMLCVEDALDALSWIESIGGIAVAQDRCNQNLEIIANWVSRSYWADFLAVEVNTRSNTSICLKIVDPWFFKLEKKLQKKVPLKIEELLEKEGSAYDVNGYREAPPGLRIWGGATVDAEDLNLLLPWLDWSYEEVKQALG
tara:strand:+ start:403 stop:1527 length:1125 start_codon:yes stop_codon:yes gene_type:complete